MSESPDNISSRTVNRATALKDRIKQDSQQRFEDGKRSAADQMEEIADAIDAAGSQLDESQPTLANYASKLANGVGNVATRLRDGSIEDLYRDTRRLATEHPGMFLLGSAAVGLAIARFMKSDSIDSGAADSNDFSNTDDSSRSTASFTGSRASGYSESRTEDRSDKRIDPGSGV